jgi:hypothetical protein
MITISSKPVAKIFETQTFRECFSELFKIPGDQPGPLTHIIREYPLAVGKGGSYYRKRDGTTVPDMSYFVHVLDACIVGGVVLEHYLQTKGKDIPAMSSLIRIFFASLVLHDINKLFAPGSAQSAWELDKVFGEKEDKIKDIVGTYLEPVGTWKDMRDNLLYLILVTEERTWELADKLNPTLGKPNLEDFRRFVKLGDEISSEADTTDSLNFYRIMVEKMARLPGVEDLARTINFVKLPMVPQTLLRLKFIETLFEELTISGRRVIFRAPDSLMFIGDPIDDSLVDRLASRFRERVYLSGDVTKKLEGYPPSINKIPIEWIENIGSKLVDADHSPHDVVKDLLGKYIDIHYQRMLFWNGKKWRMEHANFEKVSLDRWGIEMSWVGKDHGLLVLKEHKDKEDMKFDPDILRKKLLANLASAKSWLRKLGIQEDIDEELQNSESLKDVMGGAGKSEKDSLIALAYAGRYKMESIDACKRAYDEILEKLTETLSGSLKSGGNDARKDVLYFLGRNLPDGLDEMLDIPDKRGMCIQCGRHGVVGLMAENAFGFEATGGTGRKLTSLVDNDKMKGKLCELCKNENALRRAEFDWVQKSKRGLGVQIFLGDIITPVDISEIIYAMSDGARKFFTDDFDIKLSNNTHMQLNYHALGFVNSPKNTAGQFYLLRKLITLIRETGFKVRLTPMFNGGGISEATFVWENAPGWVKELRWNEVRLDGVAELDVELQYMEQIAKTVRGKEMADKITNVVNARRKNPGEVIRLMWESSLNEKTGKSVFSKTDALDYYARLFNMDANNMKKSGNTAGDSEVDELARIACKMVEKPPESANDHTWMIRKAFEVYARGVAKHIALYDIEKSIAGRLKEIASRDSSNKEIAVTQGSQDFAEVFVSMVQRIGKGRVLKSELRKDIQAEFALLYHVYKHKGD